MRREKETEQRSGAEMFRQSVRLDPRFAQAHAALASGLAHFLHGRHERTPGLFEEAQDAASRALALAPDLAEVHVALGMLHQLRHEHGDAGRAFRRAIELDPRLFDAHYHYARFCVTQAQHEQAIVHYECAFEIEPDDYRPITLAIQEYQALRDSAGEQRAIRVAWAAIERRLALDPDDSAACDHGAGVLVLLGRFVESREYSERAINLRPNDPATHYNAACCAALAGNYDRAMDLLERAVALGGGNLEWMLNDNDLVPLHDHPRFRALLTRLRTTPP
jgi:adenylate cyclase